MRFRDSSPSRRPKLLHCKHTCCSVGLQQRRTSHKDVRCLRCWGITKLPPGSPCPSSPTTPRSWRSSPFGSRPSTPRASSDFPAKGCYMLPLPISKERALLSPSRRVVTIPGEHQPQQGGRGDRHLVPGVHCDPVACVLVFLLGIALHNLSCIAKRFTVISCG
ncbi:unnamed protein product [Nyctereutes procyonoides]|uniref:(raccoon dog) hypothetical protein n=1 Tax=Nyctereutes procyonoides TaxID=34880 RepID=A0A811Z550_NYCPR|nr:unnamed protein product [Nyctereutes procyonoides]